jgi:hypothetical protein
VIGLPRALHYSCASDVRLLLLPACKSQRWPLAEEARRGSCECPRCTCKLKGRFEKPFASGDPGEITRVQAATRYIGVYTVQHDVSARAMWWWQHSGVRNLGSAAAPVIPLDTASVPLAPSTSVLLRFSISRPNFSPFRRHVHHNNCTNHPRGNFYHIQALRFHVALSTGRLPECQLIYSSCDSGKGLAR